MNFKEEDALELARELIRESDIVIENFGPGVMDRLGLGYDVLKKIKPDIIMFSMPATGLYGPLKNLRTYGLSLTSTTGLDSTVGYADDDIIPVENAFSDPFNGVFGAYAILTALAHRKKTGEGQQIDFSQQEAVMQMMGPSFMDYSLNGRVGGALGNRHPLGAAAPHGVFPAAGQDKWISIVIESDDEWSNLVNSMNHPEWASSPKYATSASRLENILELHAHLAEWTCGFDRRELSERLQQLGIAAVPVLEVGDLLEDPHFQARKTFIEVDHPLGYRETIYGAYVKLSKSQPIIRPGPWIGQSNDYVFRSILGLSEEKYEALKNAQIIY